MFADYDQRSYQTSDPQEQQRELRTNVLERGRAVRLMKNGDPFFTGRTFVINQKKYPMLDVFLDDASRALAANFGAVRCIYTPKHGRRLRDIADFEDHHTYVASGGEKFKNLNYLDIAEGKRVATKGQTSPKLQLPPVRRIDAEGRAIKLSRSENLIIYVYRNGDPLTLPVKVLLVKSTLPNWENVLDEISRKVLLNNTAVLKLFAMNGELINSSQQLEYNGMYVAAGKERFKRLEYPDPKLLMFNSSPKSSRKTSNAPSNGGYSHPLRFRPVQGRTDASPPRQLPPLKNGTRYAKSDGNNTHTATTASFGSMANSGYRRPVREENDFFNQKPQQHRRGPTKEIDFDRDDGGIYKNRSNFRERPREIDENYETKIDLPVNHREAEIVDEENLYGNVGKTPRRHHTNGTSNHLAADYRKRTTRTPISNPYDDGNDFSQPKSRTNGYESDPYQQTPSPYQTQRSPYNGTYSQTHPDQRSPSNGDRSDQLTQQQTLPFTSNQDSK